MEERIFLAVSSSCCKLSSSVVVYMDIQRLGEFNTLELSDVEDKTVVDDDGSCNYYRLFVFFFFHFVTTSSFLLFLLVLSRQTFIPLFTLFIVIKSSLNRATTVTTYFALRIH